MVYTSENLSLATLELLVHLPSPLVPEDMVIVEVQVPEGVAEEGWTVAQLPIGWDAQVPTDVSQALGSEWLEASRSLLLRVPSAIVPREWNVLINPAHADFSKLRVIKPPLALDPRLAAMPTDMHPGGSSGR